MTSRSVISFPASPHKTAEPTVLTGPRAHRETDPGVPVYPGAFKPLSREDVAGILDISIRTLENWVKQGRLPPPNSIGGRRYWHPECFYAALDAMLQPGSDDGSQGPPIAPVVAKAPNVPLSTAGQRAQQSSKDASEAMLREAAERAKAPTTA